MIEGRLTDRDRSFTMVEHHFIAHRVIWWTEKNPGGLRFEGDGCSEEDTSDYDQPHPAIKVLD